MSEPQQHRSGEEDRADAVPSGPDEDGDDAPMVHFEPFDYASWVKEEREKLRNEGKEAIFHSEVKDLISRTEGESDADYTKRFIDGFNALRQRGVVILPDAITIDVAPVRFYLDGHEFDVGPDSGITKREYREFNEWMENATDDAKYADLPERFLKFESAEGSGLAVGCEDRGTESWK